MPALTHYASNLSTARVAAWLAGLFVICFIFFMPREYDWNPQARFDMTLSIVNRGTIAIDHYHWNSEDESYYGGHYYSNKAPGQSLAAVPIYAADKALLHLSGNAALDRDIGAPAKSGSPWPNWVHFLLAEYVATVYTVAVPSVLFLLLFFWFLQYYTESLLNRTILTVAFGLGTAVFPYAQVFYSHVPAAALLFAGYALLHLVCHGPPRNSPKAAWLAAHPQLAVALAGLCLGLSVLFEYTAAAIAAFIGIYALLRLPRRLIWVFIAGTIPGLVSVLGYNEAAYHNPLSTGYGVYAVPFWKGHEHQTFAGFAWPPYADAFFGLSFSPARGLFFLSPWLLLALPGYALWARRGGRIWILFLVIPLTFFLLLTMYSGWNGGNSAGPRYLIPMLPFLALPVVFVLEWAKSPLKKGAIVALMTLSIAAIAVETLGGTEVGYPDVSLANPLFSYSWPALLHGAAPGTILTFIFGPFIGFSAAVKLLPFLAILAAWSLFTLVGTAPAPDYPGALPPRERLHSQAQD